MTSPLGHDAKASKHRSGRSGSSPQHEQAKAKEPQKKVGRPRPLLAPEALGGPRWKVVGGADRGGIIVREGVDLASQQLPRRLSTGALIVEEEIRGDRLCFSRLTGSGPDTGWISIRLRDKELLVRVDHSTDTPDGATTGLRARPLDMADGSSSRRRAHSTSAMRMAAHRGSPGNEDSPSYRWEESAIRVQGLDGREPVAVLRKQRSSEFSPSGRLPHIKSYSAPPLPAKHQGSGDQSIRLPQICKSTSLVCSSSPKQRSSRLPLI